MGQIWDGYGTRTLRPERAGSGDPEDVSKRDAKYFREIDIIIRYRKVHRAKRDLKQEARAESTNMSRSTPTSAKRHEAKPNRLLPRTRTDEA
jgi:hypothetical protein